MKKIYLREPDGNLFLKDYVPDDSDVYIVDSENDLEPRAGYAIIAKVENGQVVQEYQKIPAKELREAAYMYEFSVEYAGKILTVDAANKLWQEYFAEGSDKATEISAAIRAAKQAIRARIPDEE